MTVDVDAGSLAAERKASPVREAIYRHAFLVRLTHWLNALAIVFMLGTGLSIFNAHPHLYWGVRGDEYDRPVVSIQAYNTVHGVRGLTQVGPITVDTTGVLGWSMTQGQWASRAWPSWITIPSFQDLADARRWHFFVAWTLVANGIVYGLWALFSGHAWRDLRPTRADLKSIPRSIIDHIKLKHPAGEAAKRYNVLQKLAYLSVIFLLLPPAILMGFAMSPWLDSIIPGWVDFFGGRQSARTIHFIVAWLMVAFVLVHVFEVIVSGLWNHLRSMITGRYRIGEEAGDEKAR